MPILTLDELFGPRRAQDPEPFEGPEQAAERARAAEMLEGLLGGRAEGLAVHAGSAAVRTARGIELVDLAGDEPRRPVRVALPGACRAVVATAGGLVAADDRGGLFRVASGVATPFASVGAPVRSLAASADRVAAGSVGRVDVLDASAPGEAARVATVELPDGATPVDLTFVGPRHLAVAAGRDGLYGVEIGGAEGRVAAWAEGRPRAVAPAVLGPLGRRCVVAWSLAGRVDVYEWGQRGRLRRLSGLDLEIDGGAPDGGAVAVDGATAYVATDTRLLHVVDLRTALDRCGPTLMSTCSVGTGTTGVAVTSRRVLVSDSFGGLIVLDRHRLDTFDDEDPILYRLSFAA